MSTGDPFDKTLAALLVRPLLKIGAHPNHITTLSLLLGISASVLFSFFIQTLSWLAALLFMLAVFIDHIDGELARQGNMSSSFGHKYDYIVGGVNYTLLFMAIGLGLFIETGTLIWLITGLMAGLSNPLILYMRMKMDMEHGAEAVAHPRLSIIELEDFIYLIGPITWILSIEYFFIPFASGTIGYLIWTWRNYKSLH